MKKLVVGLGNPEGKYFQTYHNIGFLCADLLAQKLGVAFRKNGNQMLGKGVGVFVLKPLTYMNNSGQAVVAVARKQGIAPEDIIVFVDDLYIDKGNIRIAVGGSSAGHNGITSINQLLGTSKYIKIRVGIKPEVAPKNGTANYVLARIDEKERGLLDEAIEKAVTAAVALLGGEALPLVQNKFNVTNAAVSNDT